VHCCSFYYLLFASIAISAASAFVVAFEIGPGFSPDILGQKQCGLQPLGVRLLVHLHIQI
jgi:hypothetical protein